MIPDSTIFVPGLYGQYKVWKEDLRPLLDQVEDIVFCGNVIGLNDYVKDNQFNGSNYAIAKFIDTFGYSSKRSKQIIGPNEILGLSYPGEYCCSRTIEILQKWWLDRDSRCTTTLAHNGRLISFGGMTYGQWESVGKPETAEEAANRLNEKFDGTLYPGPCYNLNKKPSMSASPTFANPYYELLPSWIGQEQCPFDQIYASGDMNTRLGREMSHSELSPLYFVDTIKYRKYGSIVTINDTTFTAVDLLLDGKRRNTLDTHRNMLVEIPPRQEK